VVLESFSKPNNSTCYYCFLNHFWQKCISSRTEMYQFGAWDRPSGNTRVILGRQASLIGDSLSQELQLRTKLLATPPLEKFYSILTNFPALLIEEKSFSKIFQTYLPYSLGNVFKSTW
jgi:hypothetical protein